MKVLKFLHLKVFCLYAFVLSMTDIGVPNTIFSAVLMVSLLGAAFSLITLGSKSFFKVDSIDCIMILYLLFATFSTIINFQNYNTHTLNHILSKYFVFFLFYFNVKNTFLFLSKSVKAKEDVYRWLLAGAVLSLVFCITEFIFKNYFSVEFDFFFPRLNPIVYDPTLGGDSNIVRARGFAEESGHYALFIELIVPILGAHLWQNKKFKSFSALSIFSLIAITLTFSTISQLALFPAIITAILIHNKLHIDSKFIITFGLLILLTLLSLLVIPGSFESLVYKITENGFNGRHDNIEPIFALIEKSDYWQLIFGFGSGSFYNIENLESGIFSLPFLIFVEMGFVGLFLLFIFVTLCIQKIRCISDLNVRYAFALSFSFALWHYWAIGNYYYPWIWFLIAIISFEKLENKIYRKTVI